VSGAEREDDTPAKRRSRGHWVYVAVGGAIVDHAGTVRKILHLSPNLGDLAIERTKPLLQEVGRRMVTVAPAKLCETGRHEWPRSPAGGAKNPLRNTAENR